MSKYSGVQKEHQVKNLVFDDYFDTKKFSWEQEIDNFEKTVKGAIKTYLNLLSANPGGEEIQYRTPLENLINAIKLPQRDFSIIQEDRHSGIEVAGTPDFFVYEDDHTLLKRLVGFIECKKPSYQLEKLIDSNQIKKYSQTCENIIITKASIRNR